jgi:hypothetical protein
MKVSELTKDEVSLISVMQKRHDDYALGFINGRYSCGCDWDYIDKFVCSKTFKKKLAQYQAKQDRCLSSLPINRK